MLYLKKKTGALMLAGIIFLTGCTMPKSTSDSESDAAVNIDESMYTEEDFEIMIPSEDDALYKEYENMIAMGQRMKALIDDKELDETVIIVNGQSIARRDFESAKVYAEFSFGEESLKDRVNNMIRDAVLETEAKKLGISGSEDEVDAYIASIKEFGFDPIIAGYMKGIEVSAEEYCKILEEMMYRSTVRNNVWLSYKEEHEEEMKNEAMKNGVELVVIEKEYREKYETQLIENADIKIFDTEIRSLIDN